MCSPAKVPKFCFAIFLSILLLYSKKQNSSHTVNKLGYVQIKCSKLDHLCSVTLKLPPLIVAYSDEKCFLVVLVFPPNTCVLLSSSSSSIPSPYFHRPPIQTKQLQPSVLSVAILFRVYERPCIIQPSDNTKSRQNRRYSPRIAFAQRKDKNCFVL